jgi:hypothetical protein
MISRRIIPLIPRHIPAISFRCHASSVPAAPSSSHKGSDASSTGVNGNSAGEALDTDIVSKIALSEHAIVS